MLLGRELWLFLTDKISTFAQLPKECYEAFRLLPKPCLSKEVRMKPKRRFGPNHSGHVFSHSALIVENQSTDVTIGCLLCCPRPRKLQDKTGRRRGKLKRLMRSTRKEGSTTVAKPRPKEGQDSQEQRRHRTHWTRTGQVCEEHRFQKGQNVSESSLCRSPAV